jgi:hypothetical protein
VTSPYLNVIAEMTALVDSVVMDERTPKHGDHCDCRLCTTDRWLRSPEAQEAGNNWRTR